MGDGEVNGGPGEVNSEVVAENGGAAAAKCEQDMTTELGSVCPECAAATSLTHVDPPWPVRRKILVQCAALLIAIGYTVWRNVESWPVLPPPTTYAGQPYSAEFPSNRLTKADIERYAAGEIADGRLIDDLDIKKMLGNPLLGVRFVPPKGEGTAFVRYGWPTEVIVYRYDAAYDDVYEKTNPSANAPTFRNGWYPVLTYIWKGIDAQGRRKAFLFIVKGLAGPPLVVLIVWGLARLVRAVLFRVRLADRQGSRRRDRFTRRLPQLIAALAVIGVGIASCLPRVPADYAFALPWNLPLTETLLTESELEQIATEPSGEAMLAKRILEALAGVQSDESDCLVYGWRSDFSVTMTNAQGGWPPGVIGHSKFEQEGFVPGSRPERSLKLQRTNIALNTQYGTSRVRGETYTFSFYTAAQVFLGFVVLWIVAGTGTWLTGWWIRKGSARRVALTHCVRCGYDLKGL